MIMNNESFLDMKQISRTSLLNKARNLAKQKIKI